MGHLNLSPHPTLATLIGSEVGMCPECVSERSFQNFLFLMEKRITPSTRVTKKIGYKPGLAGCLRMEPVKAEKSQVIESSLFEPLDPTEPEVGPAPGYFSCVCQ